MKTLIIYATSHGASATAAAFLAEKLGACDVVDLKKDTVPDLAAYDTVVLGGSIHIGQPAKAVRKFIATHHDTLASKKLGLYLCCMYEGDVARKQFDDAYPQDLRDKAAALGIFGGTFDFERMNFMEKAIVKKVAGVTESVSRLDSDEMERFANALKVMT